MLQSNPHKLAKFNHSLHISVAAFFRDLFSDTDIIVSVSSVDASSNLKSATIWVSIVKGHDKKVLEILRKNRARLESWLFIELSMRAKIQLNFRIDFGARYASHIEELLKKAA